MENTFYVYVTEHELKNFQKGKEALAFFDLHSHSYQKNEYIYALSVTMEQCFARFRNGTIYIKLNGWVEYA